MTQKRQALVANFQSTSKISGFPGFEFYMYALVEDGQTPQQVVDRLVAAGFIGLETAKLISVLERDGEDLVSRTLDGVELQRTHVGPEVDGDTPDAS